MDESTQRIFQEIKLHSDIEGIIENPKSQPYLEKIQTAIRHIQELNLSSDDNNGLKVVLSHLVDLTKKPKNQDKLILTSTDLGSTKNTKYSASPSLISAGSTMHEIRHNRCRSLSIDQTKKKAELMNATSFRMERAYLNNAKAKPSSVAIMVFYK